MKFLILFVFLVACIQSLHFSDHYSLHSIKEKGQQFLHKVREHTPFHRHEDKEVRDLSDFAPDKIVDKIGQGIDKLTGLNFTGKLNSTNNTASNSKSGAYTNSIQYSTIAFYFLLLIPSFFLL